MLRSEPPCVELVPGKCWWCGSPADTREHRLKKSDLIREYGKAPFDNLRTLTRFSGEDRHDFRGPNSKLMKFKASMCARCNNARSQPFDEAWDKFAEYLAGHEDQVLQNRAIDLREVFGEPWREEAANVARYMVKHLLCRIVDELSAPARLPEDFLEFLDGGAYPEMLQLDLRIDLGVVEMLNVTRAEPPPEQPEAADAGFLGTTALSVMGNKRTGQWSEPSAGLAYRYLGIFWRCTSPSRNPFQEPVVRLGVGDDFLPPAVREALAADKSP